MRSREEDYKKREDLKEKEMRQTGFEPKRDGKERARGGKRKGMWISLPPKIMAQVDVIVRASPRRPDGSKVFRKHVIEQAVEEFVSKFDGAEEIQRIFEDMQESLAEERSA